MDGAPWCLMIRQFCSTWKKKIKKKRKEKKTWPGLNEINTENNKIKAQRPTYGPHSYTKNPSLPQHPLFRHNPECNPAYEIKVKITDRAACSTKVTVILAFCNTNQLTHSLSKYNFKLSLLVWSWHLSQKLIRITGFCIHPQHQTKHKWWKIRELGQYIWFTNSWTSTERLYKSSPPKNLSRIMMVVYE